MRCNSATGVSKCQKPKGIRQQCKKETTKKQSSMHLNTSCSWDFKSWTHQLGTLNFEALHACPPQLRRSQLPSTWIGFVNCVPFGSNELALLIVNVFGRRFASFCEGKHRIFLHVWRPKRFKSLNSETQLTNSQSTNPDSLPRDQSFWFILMCLAKLCTLLSKHLHF